MKSRAVSSVLRRQVALWPGGNRVCGFSRVAMNNAQAVGGVEGGGELPEDVEGFGFAEAAAAAGEALAEGLAGEGIP